MDGKNSNSVVRLALNVLPLAIFLLIWQLSVPNDSRLAFLISNPSEIASAIRIAATSTQYWSALFATLQTLVIGYGLGVAFGFVTGVCIWFAGRYAGVAENYLIALGALPIFALAPLIIFAAGIGATTRIIVVFVSVWIPVALATYSNAREIEDRFRELISVLKGTRVKVLQRLVGPGAFFLSVSAMRTSVNTGLVATFVAEWISSEIGLAKDIFAAMSIYNVPKMWVGLLTFATIAVAFNILVTALERHLTPWRKTIN